MKKRNAFTMLFQLLGLIQSLIPYMIFAILFGSMGHFMALLIPVLGISLVFIPEYKQTIVLILVGAGLLRGVFRYIEQALNHELAFRVLAQLRDKIFSKMRALAPAILEGKDRGNLISIITGDIEHLEVFFAHTISPIFIALVVNTTVVVVMFTISPIFGYISLGSYIMVGLVFPVVFSSKVRGIGLEYRNNLGLVNSKILESVMGVKDLRHFNYERKKGEGLHRLYEDLNQSQRAMNTYTILNNHAVELVIFISNILFILVGYIMNYDVSSILIGLTLHTSSFGPVIALSNLANNMYHVLAAGDRVLNLLSEESSVMEIIAGANLDEINDISISNLDFSYGDIEVLNDVTMDFMPHKITGIQGASGSGKSTFLKVLMRYYEANEGAIKLNGLDINAINTVDLRSNQGYMSQTTDLFQMSIKDNIKMGNNSADDLLIIQAAKRAGIHDFIMELPRGYDTPVSEFGNSVSSGEKQRISLARLFLKDASLFILDEPSSNLDSLNEAILLDSLRKFAHDKTIIITSHRASTLNIAHTKWFVEKGNFTKM